MTANFIKCIPVGEESKRTVYRVFLSAGEKHIGEVRWYDKADRYVFCLSNVAHLWIDSRGLRLIAEFCDLKTKELVAVA